MILVVDNYDSFVHNLARYFTLAGADVTVVRNDAVSVDDIRRMVPDAVVLSPGPGTPAEAGVSCAVVQHLSGSLPIFGVCLGHQCIGAVFGGTIARARRPMHGLASPVTHGGERLFAGLANPFAAGRYHSLIVEPTATMSQALAIEARSPEGEVMALSHRTHPTLGVQFHPESILTVDGDVLVANFLALAKAWHLSEGVVSRCTG